MIPQQISVELGERLIEVEVELDLTYPKRHG